MKNSQKGSNNEEEKVSFNKIDNIAAGDTYLNVHTDKYPDGELLGEIK